MKRSEGLAAIISLFLLWASVMGIKSILFPPDPEYVARKQELALEHAARMHTIVEVGTGVFLALLIVLAIIGIFYLYHRVHVVTIRPDDGGQYPIVRVKTPDGRVMFINPNRLMAGAGVVDESGLRQVLPEDPGLLHIQHRVTTQAQAVQMARAAGAHGAAGLWPRQPDDSYYDDLDVGGVQPPVAVLERVTGKDVDRVLGLDGDDNDDGDW